MKRTPALLLGAAAALGAAACVSDATSIQVQYAMSDEPTSACAIAMSSNQRGGGSVDIGNTSHYLAAFKVVNSLDSADETAGGQTVNPGTRNNFSIEGVKLSYASSVASVTIPDQQVGASGMVAAGDSLAFMMDLLTPQAVTQLGKYFSSFSTSALRASQVLSVRVSVVLSGKFANGNSFETAAFDFPLEVYELDTLVCNSPRLLEVVTGYTAPACSNWGQDGVPYQCVCTDCGGCSTSKTCNTTSCACE